MARCERVGALGFGVLAAAAAGAQTLCPAGPGWLSAEAPAHRLVFQPQPVPVPVGRHFRVEVRLCATASPVRSLRVDADMPAHRHGMNYRATVRPLSAGRWRAEGLMFHMPGRWRFVFELDTAAGPQRLTQEIDVE